MTDMRLHIREAGLDDLPAIVGMLANDILGSAREQPSLPLHQDYLAAFEAIAADPNQHLLVAESAGEIVGTMQLSFLPGLSHVGGWKGQIEAVQIASERRGEGLGAEMVRWAIARCRARGCRVVQLTSNLQRKDAHRFYERLGFAASHVGMKMKIGD